MAPSYPRGVMIWTNLNLLYMIWTNLNFHYIRKLSYKFQLFWPSGSWEEDFLMTLPYFLSFIDYLPLRGDMFLQFNNLNSPLPKDALYQVWSKLAQWFLRRSRKCEKFTDGQTDRRTDGQTDGRTTDTMWSEKLTWAFGSGELKGIQYMYLV